jgi:hypothetical protein
MMLLKLLLSCPGIKNIIVLLRRKNEKSSSDRLSEILSSSVSVTCFCFTLLGCICYLSYCFRGEVRGINGQNFSSLLSPKKYRVCKNPQKWILIVLKYFT